MFSTKMKGGKKSREEKRMRTGRRRGGEGGKEAERKGDLLFSKYANYRIKKK